MDPQQAHAWLSTARFEPFLSEAYGDHVRAVALYDWHADTAAACFGMVHHFEILVRNRSTVYSERANLKTPSRTLGSWTSTFSSQKASSR